MKVELNKQLDKEVYVSFCDAVIGGADFGKKIRNEHTSITKENYSEYIDDFYAKHGRELENAIKDSKECFNEIKDVLFLELQKYFGQDYSKEKYTCYLSILADGVVFACRRFKSPVGRVPNQSLYDIFLGQKMNQYRDFSKLEKCNKCELLYYCRGCMAVTYGSFGNWMQADPQCWKVFS